MKILILEQEKSIVGLFKKILSDQGFELQVTSDTPVFFDSLETFHPDLIFLSSLIDKTPTDSLIARLSIPFVLLLCTKDFRPASEILKLGAQSILVKDASLQVSLKKYIEFLLKETRLALLSNIFEDPEGQITFTLDSNYCYTFFSRSHAFAMKQIWGVDIAIGQNMLNFIRDPKDRQKAKNNFDRTLKGESFCEIEEYGDTSFRRSFWENRYAPVFDMQHNPVGILVYVIDVSELKNAEKNLSDILELAPSAFFHGDPQGHFINVNREATFLTEYTEEELLSLNMNDLFPPTVLNDKPLRYDFLDEGKIIKTERNLLKKGNTLIAVEMVSRKMPDGTYQSFMRDISDRIRIQKDLQSALNRYAQIFRESPIGLLEFDENAVIQNCNTEFARIIGSDMKVLVGFDMLHRVNNRGILNAVQKALQGQKGFYEGEYVSITAYKTTYVRAVFMAIVKNNLFQVGIGLVEDITAQKEAEQSLRENEANYHQIIETLPDALIIHQEEKVVFANSAAHSLFKVAAKESLIGRPTLSLLHPDSVPLAKERIKYIRQIGKPVPPIEEKMICADGSILLVEISAAPTVFSGKPAVLTIARDLTEIHKAMAIIRENEKHFRSLVNATTTPLVVFHGEQIFYANRAFCELSGYSLEEIETMSYFDFIHPEEHSKILGYVWDAAQGKETSSRYEVKSINKAGNTVWIDFSSAPITWDNQPATIASIINITERKQSEQVVLKEKERLAITLKSIGDGVISTDIEGRITLMNKVAEQLTGWIQKEAIGVDISKVFRMKNEQTGDFIENPVNSVLASKSVFELSNHTQLISKDGQIFTIANTASPIKDSDGEVIGVVLVFQDRTEKEKLIAAAQNNQKLESLGILAGGIAHDFNNLLTGIYGFIELAQMESKNPRVNKNLAEVQQSITRARALTQQLLTFSKGGAPNKTIASLAPVLFETTRFALSGSNISTHFDISEDLAFCEFDRNQIAQVIDNLAINAKQAMPLGGTLVLSARNITFEKNYKFLKKGNYIEIKVKDTGAGIPPSLISHIFDPFFSTKETGHGLGLATSYSIIKRHGGSLSVESTQNVGTIFTILLPATAGTFSSFTKSDQQKFAGHGLIVIMDDEPIIRKMMTSLLQSIGYDVLSCEDGDQALEIAREQSEIRAVFLDITVPGGKGGKEVIKDLRSLLSDLPIFVASGYAADPIMIHPKDFGFTASIRKPFTLNELQDFLLHYLEG